MMKRNLKVGDLAKMTGLTVRTLRFYDQIGLFSPSAQTESGHRLYREDDLPRLQQIVSLKEMGLSLEEIRSALEDEQFSPLDIVKMQIARIKEQLDTQRKLLDRLEHAAGIMQGQNALSAQDFVKLLQLMKQGNGKRVLERQLGWERRLDQLGDYLTEESAEET